MARLHPPAYVVVIDAEGAELVETRRDITGLTVDEVRIITTYMQAGLGDGCHLVQLEGPMPAPAHNDG